MDVGINAGYFCRLARDRIREEQWREVEARIIRQHVVHAVQSIVHVHGLVPGEPLKLLAPPPYLLAVVRVRRLQAQPREQDRGRRHGGRQELSRSGGRTATSRRGRAPCAAPPVRRAAS